MVERPFGAVYPVLLVTRVIDGDTFQAVVLQATKGKDRQGRPRRGVWLVLPVGYVQALGWEPGTVVEVRIVGRHLELHRQAELDREAHGG
ncbi:MAG: hypothetical protein WAW99_05685 [Candidatus Bipolaricaulis anaerobius]